MPPAGSNPDLAITLESTIDGTDTYVLELSGDGAIESLMYHVATGSGYLLRLEIPKLSSTTPTGEVSIRSTPRPSITGMPHDWPLWPRC